MAHLDTAYKLGALQAQADFETEINKMAQNAPAPAPPPRMPGTAVPPEAPPTAPGKGNQVNPTLGAPDARVRTIR